MRQHLKRNIHLYITIVTISICVLYVFAKRVQLNILESFEWRDIFVVISLISLSFIITGYSFRLLLGLLKISLTPKEVVGLSIITSFGNYFGPIRPGAMLKAIYLKSAKGLFYAQFTSVFAMNNFLGIWVTGVTGLILYFFLEAQYSNAPLILFWGSVIFAAIAMVPFVFRFPLFRINRKGFVFDVLEAAAEGFNMMRSQKMKLAMISLTYLLHLFVVAMAFYVTFKNLDMKISLLLACMMAVFVSASSYIPLTPSNIGIQEVVGASLFTISGFDFTKGMIGLAVIRLVHFLITFSLAPIFMHSLFKGKSLSKAKFW